MTAVDFTYPFRSEPLVAVMHVSVWNPYLDLIRILLHLWCWGHKIAIGVIRHKARFVTLFSDKGKQVLLSIQTIWNSAVADNVGCICLSNNLLHNLRIFSFKTEQIIMEELDAKSQRKYVVHLANLAFAKWDHLQSFSHCTIEFSRNTQSKHKCQHCHLYYRRTWITTIHLLQMGAFCLNFCSRVQHRTNFNIVVHHSTIPIQVVKSL